MKKPGASAKVPAGKSDADYMKEYGINQKQFDYLKKYADTKKISIEKAAEALMSSEEGEE